MGTTQDRAGVRVQLAVRTLAPDGRQQQQADVIRRLRRLEGEAVDEASVDVWGRRVPLDTVEAETERGREIRSKVRTFEQWAERNGVSVSSYFQRREVNSGFTGEAYTAVVLPAVVLAEYHGEDLHWVSPCRDGDTVYTVGDRLDAIEAASVGEAPAGTPTPRPPLGTVVEE